jgi:hypothetical protein
MKKEKKEKLIDMLVYPKVTCITEADRRSWWKECKGKGSYNSALLSRVISIKRQIY